MMQARIKRGFTEKVIFKCDLKGKMVHLDGYRWK